MSEKEGKKEVVDSYRKYEAIMKDVLKDFSEQYINKQMSPEANKNLSEENSKKMARLIAAFNVSRSAYDALKNGNDYNVVSNDAFDKKVNDLYSSEEFKRCIDSVTEGTMHQGVVEAFRAGQMSRVAGFIIEYCEKIKIAKGAIEKEKEKNNDLLTEKDNKKDKVIEEKNLGALTNDNILGGSGK